MKSTDFTRSDRLSDQIKTELSSILVNQVKDPRLEGLTIIRVELSNDIKKAYVFFSTLNSFTKVDFEEIKVTLDTAKGFIRSNLAKRLRIKRLPELNFQEDQFN